jgi:methyltransferase (TIGR00027 family)
MTDRRSLAATARWTAAARAAETVREDALVRDPWAERLAGPAGLAWLRQRTPESVLPMVLRTRYFDDWLQEIVERGLIQQVVLPAAGLDTRAFRLPWPAGARCFELDRPGVIDRKEQILTAMEARSRCERRTIAADLSGGWPQALIEAGFDRIQPSAWLLEGLLFYLPTATIGRVLDEVTRLAAPGSRLGFDVINAAMLTSPWTRPWVDMQAAAGAPWIGTLEDPVGFLAARGWQATLTQAGQPDASHGRWRLPVIPTTMPDMPHDWFVTAERS